MQHRPAQFAEETKRADKNVAYGLITSTILEAVMGLAFVLSFLFCLPVRLLSWPDDARMTGPIGICAICLHLIALCLRMLLSLAFGTCLSQHAIRQQWRPSGNS